jgi:hypothetical protein
MSCLSRDFGGDVLCAKERPVYNSANPAMFMEKFELLPLMPVVFFLEVSDGL